MTEEQIERAVESKINRLDKRFLTTAMTQEEYDTEMREIREWADAQYEK